MMRNSIRQLLRTRVRTLLFFFLISLCALLVCLGGNLIHRCKENIEHFKDVFVTIGTVEQTAVSVSRVARYDQESKNYTYYNRKEYGENFSIDELLNMEGVTYISGPERRPYYPVFLPGYKMIDDNAGYNNRLIMIASPIEDCIPAGPVKMNLKKTVFSVYRLNTGDFYFCDHYNDNPEPMYADKTYIMCVLDGLPHGFRMGNEGGAFEYIPVIGPSSSQVTPEGEPLPSIMTGEAIEEINDEFYEKGHDKYWETYANELELYFHSVPVTPTDDLNLMPCFYNGDVAVKEGRPLDQNDFEQGNAVCLISFAFAKRNNIKVGDQIPLAFRMAD